MQLEARAARLFLSTFLLACLPAHPPACLSICLPACQYLCALAHSPLYACLFLSSYHCHLNFSLPDCLLPPCSPPPFLPALTPPGWAVSMVHSRSFTLPVGPSGEYQPFVMMPFMDIINHHFDNHVSRMK